MKLSVSKVLFYLLLLLPISFKIEFSEGFAFYPQELLLPFVVILLFTKKIKSVPKISYPFIFYLLALGIVFVSTAISQFSIIDLSGLFKTAKYILYLVAVILLSNYNFKDFVQKFNKIALICIGATLSIYLYNLITFNSSVSDFVQLATWDLWYIPSGFSNLNLNIYTGEFSRATGNHGVYGSYLVLIYIINLSQILKGESTKLNKILIALALLNMLLMTSRETLLLFLVVNFAFFIKPLFRLRLKLRYVYVALFFVGGVSFLIINDINFSLIQKLNHTIESFSESGQEANVSLRFGVWHLILSSFLLYPAFLLFGYGYNTPLFTKYLTLTNNHFNLYDHFVTVPESVFFFFLTFGGIAALALILLFFISIALETFKIRNTAIIAELLLYYIIGLFITNNTGGSILSDLLLAQFALVYLWIHKVYVQNKNIVPNSSS